MINGPMPRYRELVRSGAIHADPAQRAAVEKLQLLHMRLADYDPAKGKQVALGWLGFGRKAAKADKASAEDPVPTPPKGVKARKA